MKAHFLSLALFASVFASTAQAETVPARIKYLNCYGYQLGVGSVAFVYTGGDFNVTEVSAFGVPCRSRAYTDDNSINVTCAGDVSRL
jgi:hypothetical protein